MLLAISPTLTAIIPNTGDVLLDGQTRNIAPAELTFRFSEGQTIDPATVGAGIQVVGSGGDGVYGNGNDVSIVPGFIGIGVRPNEVVLRFANTLPDDFYRITVVGSGPTPLKNITGDVFNNGVNQVTNLRLDLPPQVTAVVPQPITRNGAGNLVQARNQIEVYFNDDPLNVGAAQNPNFYQLIFTASTAKNQDDVIYNPTSVVYDANANRATLTFAADLASLGSGLGTYRLRIGDNRPQVPTPIVIDVALDAGSSLSSARVLPNLSTQGQILSGGNILSDVAYLLNFPGGTNEPGHRDIPVPGESHTDEGPDADVTQGITTMTYDFRSRYGFDPQGNQLFNVITEAQKQRAREAFALYGHFLGVNFVEKIDVDTTGVFADFGIVTGDPRAIDPLVPTGRGGLFALTGNGIAVLDNAENWGNSEFGGAYFQVVTGEIGRLLGLENAYDLPPVTLLGTEGETAPSPAEGIFPGFGDIIHGRHLYRPESRDVDMYRFDVTTSGRFTVEIIAERMADSSMLDSVITLFDSAGRIVARNDNYFSQDSFLDLDLSAGQYYVAVSSTGNTAYNPLVADSGLGGTTEGSYQLRLVFNPTPSGSLLVDTTGTILDGDRDGAPGGAFNFWFDVSSAANTIYVDKVAPSAGADGTLARPYNNIALALAAAGPGSIVRVVGNGGADGNLATLADNRAYEIGFDNTIAPSVPLSDGISLDLPKDVTLMIDAGAVFKLSQANINAGSFSQGVDLAGGAIQVLGTPLRSVIFTSYHHEQVGVDTNPRPTTPRSGDWGGLVFRHDSDHEAQGIFLNYVAYANIGFGGGSVIVDSVEQVFSPLHLEKARPTLVSNLIAGSADAAISADPDSFEETIFRDDGSNLSASVRFVGDYRRVGPDVHANTLVQNSINGLFVRIRTDFGTPVDKLTVAGRFDDTDIVHVISENLFIQGTPGGPTLRADGTLQHRLDAQLAVDPGIIVKLQGARIEVELGAQLIAEGRAQTQVVFTSQSDDRYGAGGVFDTTNDGAASAPVPGDWGGFYFQPTSKGSIDRALITFGGGDTPIEGGFAHFNAVEIRQADVRITNSILERNADGFDVPTDRNGRAVNAPATIFVLGAQPILINNVLRNNQGDAISVDSNSLTAALVGDRGRSTGRIERFTTFDDNHGPLVQDNVLQDNEINAMGVRGATNQANIDFRIGPSLANNPQAVAAFEAAAQIWESILHDPITVTLDIDFAPLSPSVLGQTVSVSESVDFDLIRQLMIDDASPDETMVYDLPTFAQLQLILPDGFGVFSTMDVNRANLLALGVPSSQLIFQPSAYDPFTPIDGTIEFNSDSLFDFNPADGISPGFSDFVGTAVHEIGHALGFVSVVDEIDLLLSLGLTGIVEMQTLDLFRLRPSDGGENFTFAPRMLDPRFARHVFYDGGIFNRADITFMQPSPPIPAYARGDIPLSRGTEVGDGNQASHWLDNDDTALPLFQVPIGIMDPVAEPDAIAAVTDEDKRAFNLIGYELVPRSASISTQAIWDDTDIVHVVREEIVVSNFHSSGGLRLQSSSTESLVVKLDGDLAGFTSNGERLEINDRIGGTLQVIGTPGHPVVMTSLADNTVGAGVDLQGRPLLNTVPSAAPLAGATSQMNIEFRVGPGLAGNTAALAAFEEAAGLWEAYFDDPITIVLDIDLPSLGQTGILGLTASETDAMSYDAVRQLLINGAGPDAAFVNRLPTFAQLQTTLPAGWTVNRTMEVNRANLLALGVPRNQLGFTPSAFDPTTGIDGSIEFNADIDFDYDASDGISTGFISFVEVAAHEIGHAMGFVSAVDEIDFNLDLGGSVMLNPLDLFRMAPGAGAVDFTNSPRLLDPEIPDHVFYDGGQFLRHDVTITPLRPGDIPLATGSVNGDGTQASHWKDNSFLGIMRQIGLLDPIAGPVNPITTADVRAFDLLGYDFVQRPQGAWRGIKIDEYSNDRNVAIANESELAYTGNAEANNLPSKAQFLGTLAKDEKNGDDNRRLGFEVQGVVSFDRTADVDVYSFNGTAGTEVWLDIDNTSVALDTVVELIDASGAVLARSNNSADELANPSLLLGSPTVAPMTMSKSIFSGEDLYTTNPRDAGMRLVLPGVAGATNVYYVRVRSSSNNLANVVGGQTSGAYQLQIRLRELDEVPGTTVRYADIRFAQTGIEVLGGPAHSPLAGEIGRATTINADIVPPLPFTSQPAFARLTAQDLGNLLASDRATLSLSSRQESFDEVQWYKFSVDYQAIQAIPDYNDGPKTMSLVFDVDYADGIARPDLTLALFEVFDPDPSIIGLKLLGLAKSSNLADDQPPPIGGSGANDLSRGSFGKFDPFLGSIQLEEGTIKTYYIAITSDAISPVLLAQYDFAEIPNKLIRLEPVNSVRRIVEDHIGSVGYITGDPDAMPPNIVFPQHQDPILPTDPMLLPSVIENYTLGDMVLYVSDAQNLTTINPATGLEITPVGNYTGILPMNDIAIRTDGYMFGVQTADPDDQDENAGRLVNIHPGNASLTEVGLDGIADLDPANPMPEDLAADAVDAMAYQRFDIGGQPGTGDGNSEHYVLYYSVRGAAGSVLYIVNPTDGEGANDQEMWGPVSGDSMTSVIGGVMGLTTGMAFIGSTLYGVSDGGKFYSINTTTGAATLIGPGFAGTAFSGLSAGPINLDGGALANTVFAITTDGLVMCIDAATGLALPIFADVDMDGQPDLFVDTGVLGATGLALSPVDFSLWHPTSRRSGLGNPGHGINATHDNTRQDDPGDTAFVFGFELGGGNFGVDPVLEGDLAGYGTLQNPGPQPRPDWLEDDLFAELQIGNNYNLPGGAHGNLITLPFSTEGYDAGDALTMYFTYYYRGLAGGDVPSVSITVDGGLNWNPLPVNFFDAVTPGTDPIDDNFWRQARADISQFAGEEEVQFRFEFAAGIDANVFEGVFIDDIIVGPAGRGEIATGPVTPLAANGNVIVLVDALGNTLIPFYDFEAAFFQSGIVPNPGNPTQVLTGAFQLEIRRATEFARIIDPVTGMAEIYDQFQVDDRLTEALTLVVPSASTITVDPATVDDGDTFTIDDGVNAPITFEFDSDGAVAGTNVPVPFAIPATARDIVLAIEAAVNAVDASPVPFNAHVSHNAAGDAFYVDGAVGPLVGVGVTFDVAEDVLDGQSFLISDGIHQRTFEFDRDGAVAAGNLRVPINLDSPEGLAKKVRDLINAANSATFVSTASSRPTSARVDLNRVAEVNTDATPRMSVLQFGGHSIFAAPGDQILDGETFEISDGFNSRVFEFDLDGTVAMGHVAIPFAGMETADEMAALIFTAINSQTGADFAPFARPPVAERVDVARAVHVTENVVSFLFKAISYPGIGDRNLESRDQGQIILEGNRITYSSDYGIAINTGTRDQAGSHQGAVRNLRELNSARLVPGVVITNNIIAYSGIAGISISGDPNGDRNGIVLSLSPVPFGRIVNNTVYGTGLGVGIRVQDNSSPTILNNIIAHTRTGIRVSANSATTVVGATLFQGNFANTAGAGLGSFPIVIGPNDPLFVNAATGNFNLATGSRAIDSSLNSLADRPAMTTVAAPLGIGPSPILAPLSDLTGKLRIDDPSKPSEPGLGQNVFKDRGALDRSDFTGPTAALLNPVDNDASGIDQNPALNNVLVAGQSLQNFALRLIDDAGTGIDDSSVASSKFVVRRDGVVLVEGVDYVFSYDATNNVARFTPLVGVWLTDRVYTITVDNTAATGIKDLAGNRLLPNQAVDQTMFTVALKPVDFGDAPDGPYATLLASGGARHIIAPGFFLGAGVTSEGDGQPSSSAAADAMDDGVLFTNVLRPGEVGTVTVTASAAGRLDAWIDFNGDGDWTDPGEQIFTNRALAAGANALSFDVSSAAVTSTYARFRFSSAGNLGPAGLADDGEVEDYQVEIPSVVQYSLVLVNASTGVELPKDVEGRYVALAGTAFQAQVFVDDLRAVGAAGGVQQAFADLTYDNDLVDWVAGSLVFGADFAVSTSGTILDAQQLVDEAGGQSTSAVPTGADPKRLLFTVNGLMKASAAPGSTMNVALGRADTTPAHDTQVFGITGIVPATYQSVEVVVPSFAWQNPGGFIDAFGNHLDVDNNGSIVGLDALLVINQLNNLPSYVDPITKELPKTPVPPNIPPFYVDVNGDGFLTGADALVIINYLNMIAAQQAAGGPAPSALRSANGMGEGSSSGPMAPSAAERGAGTAAGAGSAVPSGAVPIASQISAGSAAPSSESGTSVVQVSPVQPVANHAEVSHLEWSNSVSGISMSRHHRALLADAILAAQAEGHPGLNDLLSFQQGLNDPVTKVSGAGASALQGRNGGVGALRQQAAGSTGTTAASIASSQARGAASAVSDRVVAGIFAEHADTDDILVHDDLVEVVARRASRGRG